MWEILETTYPIARKEYNCNTGDWFNNCLLGESDFEEKDWETILQADSDKFIIKVGEKYRCDKGKFEGEFMTVRSKIELNEICIKYDIYSE